MSFNFFLVKIERRKVCVYVLGGGKKGNRLIIW